MQSTLLASMFIMALIKRWALMFCVKPENVAEHSHQIVIITYLLAIIRNKKLNGAINTDQVSTITFYHEASEIRYSNYFIKYI